MRAGDDCSDDVENCLVEEVVPGVLEEQGNGGLKDGSCKKSVEDNRVVGESERLDQLEHALALQAQRLRQWAKGHLHWLLG